MVAPTKGVPGSVVLAVLVTLAVALTGASVWSAHVGGGDGAVDLGAAAGSVAVLAVILAAVRRPPTLDVGVVQGELVVRFHGWDALWSLRREVRIPLDHVATVQVHRIDDLWSGWWHRRIGTVVPGTIKAGWFGGRASRELWDVRAGADAIEVTLAPPSALSRVVLQVPDPHDLARRVTTATRTVRPPGATRSRVEVHLEELGQHSWWRALLTTTTGTDSTAQYRFVARRAGIADVPGSHVCEGASFPLMRWQDVDDERPRDAFSDLARQRLEELDDSLRRQGWRRTEQMGRHWWSRTYDAIT